MKDYLKYTKEWARDIAGQWNGKNNGIKEERAICALEIIEKIEELEKLLEELNS